jgi:hypothetical protein
MEQVQLDLLLFRSHGWKTLGISRDSLRWLTEGSDRPEGVVG